MTKVDGVCVYIDERMGIFTIQMILLGENFENYLNQF
jgi:hypothetical protein